jgi:hypothetical protein
VATFLVTARLPLRAVLTHSARLRARARRYIRKMQKRKAARTKRDTSGHTASGLRDVAVRSRRTLQVRYLDSGGVHRTPKTGDAGATKRAAGVENLVTARLRTAFRAENQGRYRSTSRKRSGRQKGVNILKLANGTRVGKQSCRRPNPGPSPRIPIENKIRYQRPVDARAERCAPPQRSARSFASACADRLASESRGSLPGPAESRSRRSGRANLGAAGR